MTGSFDRSIVAMPKLLRQRLLGNTSPVICGPVIRSGWNMLSSERLCLEKLVRSGNVSEDFASSCPFPCHAGYPGQVARTAGENPVTIHLCEFNSCQGRLSKFYFISLPLTGTLLWDLQKEDEERWLFIP